MAGRGGVSGIADTESVFRHGQSMSVQEQIWTYGSDCVDIGFYV